MMQDDTEYALIGEAPIRDAKRLQERLAEIGVAVRLASDPENCGSCNPQGAKVAMFVAQTDLEKVKAWAQAQGPAVQDPSAEVVFDPEQAEATCPACGTRFSTQLAECPDCGLGFGGLPG